MEGHVSSHKLVGIYFDICFHHGTHNLCIKLLSHARMTFHNDVQIELEFRSVVFLEGDPGEKPSEQGENNNKLNPNETASTGNELGSQRARPALIHSATNHALPDNVLFQP